MVDESAQPGTSTTSGASAAGRPDQPPDVDVIGVGVGPSNLGLAALLAPLAQVSALFFERRPGFEWHRGAMVPGARLQVSPLKDLVTLADPTSAYSFLNYLATHGRLYRHLIASRTGVRREEFERYYRWAADRIPGLRFGVEVTSVRLREGRFVVAGPDGALATSRNLVLGTGRRPFVPDCVTARGAAVLHSAEIMTRPLDTRGRRVVVVGGGQSGAEVVHWLLESADRLPASLVWTTRRDGFHALDDSAFSNEWFFPGYVRHFNKLSADRRQVLLARQRLASDGISADLLDAIFARLYDLDALRPGSCRHQLRAGQELIAVQDGPDGTARVVTKDTDTDLVTQDRADLVVLATGYRSQVPGLLDPLYHLLPQDADGYRVREDYSVEFHGPPGCRIFVQNAATRSHGVADANLSLLAWRNAVIANAVAGRPAYRTTQDVGTLTLWDPQPVDQAHHDKEPLMRHG